MVDDAPAPSRNDEYLLYQTLIGTFPDGDIDAAALDLYRQRIVAYLVKAAREAKTHTSWLIVNDAYEAALVSFVESLLDAAPTNVFLADLTESSRAFAWFGALNGVSMSLLHFTSPGVPDIYQGSEIADLSLVDPDNRRPVDYELRREILTSLQALPTAPPAVRLAAIRALLESPADGKLKMWVTWRALGVRRKHPELFSHGDYVPLSVAGSRRQHVVAFARRHGSVTMVALAARLFALLKLPVGAPPVAALAWGDTRVSLTGVAAGARLFDALSGQTLELDGDSLPLASAFAYLPVALLVLDAGSAA